MTPDDLRSPGRVRVAVGVTATDRFRLAPLNLESGIGFLGGVSAPSQGQVCNETVVIKRIGDNGTQGGSPIIQPGWPALGHGVRVDP